MKFELNIKILEDDRVEIVSSNPGAINPLTIIGLLEKIKTEVVLWMTLDESKDKTEEEDK